MCVKNRTRTRTWGSSLEVNSNNSFRDYRIQSGPSELDKKGLASSGPVSKYEACNLLVSRELARLTCINTTVKRFGRDVKETV